MRSLSSWYFAHPPFKKKRGDEVVARNKARIEGNDLVVSLSEKAKSADDLYNVAKEHFEIEREKIRKEHRKKN